MFGDVNNKRAFKGKGKRERGYLISDVEALPKNHLISQVLRELPNKQSPSLSKRQDHFHKLDDT